MSTLAGFDLIFELSKATALKLVESNVAFGGAPASPPFELGFPLPASAGAAYMIVTRTDLRLVGDRDVEITLTFANSSVIPTAGGALPTVTGLDGIVVLRTTLELIDAPTPHTKVISTNLGAATARIEFSTTSKQRIGDAVAGGPLTFDAFAAAAQSAIHSFIAGLGRQTMAAPTFHVVPGVRGSVARQQLERLELRNIGDQAVGLFGMLIPGRPTGNSGARATTSITAGHDVAVSVGAEAFHLLLFCPSLTTATTGLANLPPSCGGASGFEQDGVTITSIRDTFRNGHLDIDGTVTRSGFCYDATGSFHAEITFSVTGTKLNSHSALAPPDIDVDVPWYCYVAAAVLGPIGAVIAAIVKSNIDDATSSLTPSSSGNGLALQFGDTFGTSFDSVNVSPEGLTLNGRASVPVPAGETAGIKLVGSVTTSSAEEIGGGLFEIASGCMRGEYPYTQLRQQQLGVFMAVATLLGRPLSFAWRLEYWQGYYGYYSSPTLVDHAPLVGTSGTVVLNSISSHSPFPLPGGTTVERSVEIGYSIEANRLRLTNRADDGSYAVTLGVVATDSSGVTAEAATGVAFVGETVLIGGDYQERLAECARRELLDRAKTGPVQRELIPEWVPVNYPLAEDLLQLIRGLTAQRTPETDELLAHVRLAHGGSFDRALASPAAGEARSPATRDFVRDDSMQ
jgi:hypothetical protein